MRRYSIYSVPVNPAVLALPVMLTYSFASHTPGAVISVAILALIAAAVNAVFGLLLAWVLVRYRFPGRRLLDAAIDLPFALPTAVAGIAFATLYSPRNGWLGAPLKESFDLVVAFTPTGIVIALVFIGLPFVVRSVQPVLEDLDRDQEEAAATLGARSGKP